MVRMLSVSYDDVGFMERWQDVMSCCFGPETIRRVYGADCRVDDWSPTDASRRVEVYIPIDYAHVPKLMQALMPANGMVKATIDQKKTERRISSDEEDEVLYECVARCTMRLHVHLGRLVRIKPTFVATWDPASRLVKFSVSVAVRAFLPPLLRGQVEEFVDSYTRNDADRYVQSIRASMAEAEAALDIAE